MKKIALMALVCCSGMASAQIDLNQPQNWGEIFGRQFLKTVSLWDSLNASPRQDVQSFDVIKAASGKLSGAYGASLGLREERLYQPMVFWKSCHYESLAVLDSDNLHRALRKMGYKPIQLSKDSKDIGTRADQLEVWKPLNKAQPTIALLMSQKCGGDDNITLLTVFQIGETRHLAYGKVISDRFFATGSAKEADSRIQLRTPTGPTRPNSNDNILVEVYNTSAQILRVTLRVDVRDKTGRIINSYTDNTIEVKGNSPRQTAIEVVGVGAYDAIVSIESVR